MLEGNASASTRGSRRLGGTELCFALIRTGTGGDWEPNHMILAASTVAIVAIAAAIIVVALALWYILPRGGRRRR